jgi:sugar phosphate isomerase/epimerase
MSYPNAGRADDVWREEALARVGALAAVARDAGVILLHENCSGWASKNADATLEMLDRVGDEYLRLLFDLGNPAASGTDGVAFLERVLPWVEHVHVKDVMFDGDCARFVLPGAGDARIVEALELLRDSRFDGWVSVEPHLVHVVHTGDTADDAALAAAYRAAVWGVREMVVEVAGASTH